MISLIIPTRNRLHTLQIVIDSFYNLRHVSEIIFVVDASHDGTKEFLQKISFHYSRKVTKIIFYESRKGAAACRMRGIAEACNNYILFCDDDLFLEADYDEVCLELLLTSSASIVSGRHIFRLPGQAPAEAVTHFGNGLSRRAPFNRHLCLFADDAYYEGDLNLPLTNSCILTTRQLLTKFGFDPYYRRGNGYREESDFQMNAFVNGHVIIATNRTHAIHLHRSEVRCGGARTNRLKNFYWAARHTQYFYKKYWDRYAKLVGIKISRRTALILFTVHYAYTLFLRPIGRLCLREPLRTPAVPSAMRHTGQV